MKLCRVSGGSIIDGPHISFPTENKRIRYIVIVYKLSIIFIPKVKCQNNFSHKILSFFLLERYIGTEFKFIYLRLSEKLSDQDFEAEIP